MRQAVGDQQPGGLGEGLVSDTSRGAEAVLACQRDDLGRGRQPLNLGRSDHSELIDGAGRLDPARLVVGQRRFSVFRRRHQQDRGLGAGCRRPARQGVHQVGRGGAGHPLRRGEAMSRLRKRLGHGRGGGQGIRVTDRVGHRPPGLPAGGGELRRVVGADQNHLGYAKLL